MRKLLIRQFAVPAVLAALALPVFAACNSSDDSKASAKNSSSEVAIGKTDLGNVLVDSEGMTLYMFKKDKDGKSNCYDDCEKQWPPLTVEGNPQAGDGADQDLLGTVKREDGSQQVTYNDMPLYYWAADKDKGDVNGQGINDVWYVVDSGGGIVDGTATEGKGGAKADEAAALELADTEKYGKVLVNFEGMTLYMFFKDEGLDNASACYDDCLKKWTPLTVKGEPKVGNGLAQALTGTIEREDGTKQVTYAGWPLYTFNDDKQPGDLKGVGFKDQWCAVDAAGNPPVQ